MPLSNDLRHLHSPFNINILYILTNYPIQIIDKKSCKQVQSKLPFRPSDQDALYLGELKVRCARGGSPQSSASPLPAPAPAPAASLLRPIAPKLLLLHIPHALTDRRNKQSTRATRNAGSLLPRCANGSDRPISSLLLIALIALTGLVCRPTDLLVHA